MFVDTHTHLYSERFQADRKDVLERAFEAKVHSLYLPNVDHASIDGMLELEDKYPENVFPMMGLHPCHVLKDFEKELYIVESWLQKRSFAGIGEMGLDYYWDQTFIEQQKEAFKIQAEWGKKYRKPLILHTRNATPDAIQLVESLSDGSLTGIFHCFDGTAKEATAVLELGFYIGIGGVLTYKNSDRKEVLKTIPLSAVVLETDAPYLAPVPFRGKRNESSYIPYIAQALAEVYECSVEEIAHQTSINAQRVFSYKKFIATDGI